MSEILETITIESPVRQTARYVITVENPLPSTTPVTMGSVNNNSASKQVDWFTCDSKYIKVNELLGLSGNIEGSFEIEYRPLLPTTQPIEHLLTIITKELGTFKYKVIVKATQPLLRQILRFDVPLGSMQTESFIFRAYNTLKNEYLCNVQKADVFSVQKSITVDPVVGGWNGDDVRVNVNFEPTEIGEIHDVLKVFSTESGEYLCELIGNCIAPLPQGPFNLVQGSGSIEIPFRNCFTSNCTWNFSIDSTAFRMVNASANVNAKSQGNCVVFFEPKEEHISVPGGFVSSKLFITCSSKPNLPPWVFYLRGKIDLNNNNNNTKAKK
jgi:hydrocephalus-inducing protein